MLAIFASSTNSPVRCFRSFGSWINTTVAHAVILLVGTIVAVIILAICGFSDNKLQVFYLAYAMIQFVFWIVFLIVKIPGKEAEDIVEEVNEP